MLLRRITQHIKAQNWFAVFLDFLIVVCGVFIGIQVANWNERRVEARLAEYYLNSIIKDLKDDLVIHQTQQNYYKSVRENILKTDRLLASPSPNSKELVIAAYRATEIINDTANRATWDQVVSSGHLGLLPEYILKNGLAAYYKYDDADKIMIEILQNSVYRKIVRNTIPLPVQLKIREGCSDVTTETNVITGFVEDCQLDVDDKTLQEIATTIKASTAIKTEIRYQYSHVSNSMDNANGSAILVKRLLETLENKGLN